MFLVDTSVWIDFLRNRNNERVNLLETILEDGSAYLCEIVFIEICCGARDATQLKKYLSYFGQLPFVRLERDWENSVTNMIFEARRAGKTLFIAEAIISHLAIKNDLTLLSSDKDFMVAQTLFNLKLR